MHVAIAIVGYRNAADIARCLDALSASTHSEFEVVICENGGKAAFQALLAATPERLPGGQSVLRNLAPHNLGYAGGVNRCLALSPAADAWWILNPDTMPSPQALAALVARLEGGDCAAVGGVLVLEDGSVQAYGGHWSAWLARAVSLGFGATATAPLQACAIEAKQNYLSGASMLVSPRFVAEAGLMREDYFLYCEEVEWCLRARQRGLKLGFAPQALVTHVGGASTGNGRDFRARSKLSVYLNERNRLLLTRDRFPGRLPVVALAALLVLTFRFVRRSAWRQWAYALEGWAAGVRNLRGAVNLP